MACISMDLRTCSSTDARLRQTGGSPCTENNIFTPCSFVYIKKKLYMRSTILKSKVAYAKSGSLVREEEKKIM